MPTATTGADEVPTELIASFRRDGFVVVPGLLTATELGMFAPAITRAVTATWSAATEANNVWEVAPDGQALAAHPRVAGTAAVLLGADALRLWCDHSSFDEPGRGDVGAHRDQDGWPIAEARTITAWIPLDSLTAADGLDAERSCRGYVPGSHRSGLRRLLGERCTDADPVLRDGTGDGDGDLEKPVFVRIPPGSVAFHHGLTTHVVRANLGARVRRAHAVTYFADGCTRGPGPAHDSVDRTGIGIGAPIDGPVTPVVWARANGATSTPR